MEKMFTVLAPYVLHNPPPAPPRVLSRRSLPPRIMTLLCAYFCHGSAPAHDMVSESVAIPYTHFSVAFPPLSMNRTQGHNPIRRQVQPNHIKGQWPIALASKFNLRGVARYSDPRPFFPFFAQVDPLFNPSHPGTLVPSLGGNDLLTTVGVGLPAPWSEQAKVIQSMARRFLYGYLRSRAPRPRLYQPDFKAGIDHFCIHATTAPSGRPFDPLGCGYSFFQSSIGVGLAVELLIVVSGLHPSLI